MRIRCPRALAVLMTGWTQSRMCWYQACICVAFSVTRQLGLLMACISSHAAQTPSVELAPLPEVPHSAVRCVRGLWYEFLAKPKPTRT